MRLFKKNISKQSKKDFDSQFWLKPFMKPSTYKQFSYLNLLSFPLPLSDHLSLVINLLIRVIQLENKSFIIINSFFNYVHIEGLIRFDYIMKSHGDSESEIVSEWDNLSLVIHLLKRVIQLENGRFIIFIFRDLNRLDQIMHADPEIGIASEWDI